MAAFPTRANPVPRDRHIVSQFRHSFEILVLFVSSGPSHDAVLLWHMQTKPVSSTPQSPRGWLVVVVVVLGRDTAILDWCLGTDDHNSTLDPTINSPWCIHLSPGVAQSSRRRHHQHRLASVLDSLIPNQPQQTHGLDALVSPPTAASHDYPWLSGLHRSGFLYISAIAATTDNPPALHAAAHHAQCCMHSARPSIHVDWPRNLVAAWASPEFVLPHKWLSCLRLVPIFSLLAWSVPAFSAFSLSWALYS